MKVYKRENEYIVFDKVDFCGDIVEKGTERFTEIEVYLKDHPEALVDEPKPAEPTQEQKNAIRKQAILAEINALELKSLRPLREGDTERVKAIDNDIVSLREELKTL